MTGSTTSSSFIWTLLLAFFFIWNSLVLSLDLLVFSYFFASWSRTSSIYVCCIKYCCQIYESSFLQRKTIDLQAGEVSWSFYIAVKSMKTFFFFFGGCKESHGHLIVILNGQPSYCCLMRKLYL